MAYRPFDTRFDRLFGPIARLHRPAITRPLARATRSEGQSHPRDEQPCRSRRLPARCRRRSVARWPLGLLEGDESHLSTVCTFRARRRPRRQRNRRIQTVCCRIGIAICHLRRRSSASSMRSCTPRHIGQVRGFPARMTSRASRSPTAPRTSRPCRGSAGRWSRRTCCARRCRGGDGGLCRQGRRPGGGGAVRPERRDGLDQQDPGLPPGAGATVWAFRIGGYQVLDKYLKSRKGRVLSLDEIRHVARICDALAFTIEQMAEDRRGLSCGVPRRVVVLGGVTRRYLVC